MPTRLRREMTRSRGPLDDVLPKVLPSPNNRTSVVLRDGDSAAEDIELLRVDGGVELWKDPDGTPVKLASLPILDGILINLGDGSKTLAVNQKARLLIPFSCTITGWKLWTDTGSVSLGLWKDVLTAVPPTIGDSIVASAPPTHSSAQYSSSTTLTGWTKTMTRGEALICNVTSITSCTFAVLLLEVTRT